MYEKKYTYPSNVALGVKGGRAIFNDIIRNKRTKMGLGVCELSQQMGYSRSYLSLMETRPIYHMKEQVVRDICVHLRIEMDPDLMIYKAYNVPAKVTKFLRKEGEYVHPFLMYMMENSPVETCPDKEAALKHDFYASLFRKMVKELPLRKIKKEA